MQIKLTFLLHFYMTDDLIKFKLYYVTVVLCSFDIIILERLCHIKIIKKVLF